MNQRSKAIFRLPLILILFALTGCSSSGTKAPALPTKVVFPQEWSEIYPGMSEDAFYGVMGPPREIRYSEPVDGPPTFTATYQSPFAEYSFTLPADYKDGESQPKKLILSNRLQRCSYSQGENGAFEASFPVSKERAKELFMNSVAPLGFVVRNVPDEYSAMSRTTDRYYSGLNMEALIKARFTESTSGTNVYVNTESTELVWKSRDHSYAKAILMHMHCANSLFEKNYGSAANGTAAPANESTVPLVNFRMVSSRSASIGDAVEYKIADSVVVGGISFGKGGTAWGEVINIKQHTPAGDVITIRLQRIQAENGRWYAMNRDDGSTDLLWQSHDLIEPKNGTTITWARSHSIYRIGETVNVAVGDPRE